MRKKTKIDKESVLYISQFQSKILYKLFFFKKICIVLFNHISMDTNDFWKVFFIETLKMGTIYTFNYFPPKMLNTKTHFLTGHNS